MNILHDSVICLGFGHTMWKGFSKIWLNIGRGFLYPE